MESYEKIQAIEKAFGDGTAYRQFAADGRVTKLARLIAGFLQRKGMSPSAERVMSAASILDSDIDTHYGGVVTPAEVRLALDWGVRGEYGEYNGVNAERLFKYVRSYVASDERLEAVRRIAERRRRAGRSASEGDAPLRAWNSCRDTVLGEWGRFLRGGFEPFRNTPLSVPRRHVLSDAYRWLKSVGLAADDPDTRSFEARACRDARIECERKGCLDDGSVWTLAGSMMLEEFLRAARDQGYDLAGAVRSLDWTDSDKREMAWWSTLLAGREGMS